MNVNAEAGKIEGFDKNQIRCFPAYAGKGKKRIHIGGYRTAVLFVKLPGNFFQIGSLGPVKSGGIGQSGDFFFGHGKKLIRTGRFFKQPP
jgi:hypothetical protein